MKRGTMARKYGNCPIGGNTRKFDFHMAGIYLHIPFCRQACHYCDFHFSTNTDIRNELVTAMVEEIALQKDYLEGEEVQTIYFGGGTPSMLEAEEIRSLLEKITQTHRLSSDMEITLEANPDDLTPGKLGSLRSIGINRLSIGIQSFDDRILAYLNRSHSAETAIRCVTDARLAGFENISIDLIYAIPGLSLRDWKRTIDQALALRTPHVSAYTLTIEEKTAFGNWQKKGRLVPASESASAEQMEYLVATLDSNGYRQYEISNFSLPGFESRHNSSYWKGKKYLGIGPSAHSYNQVTRQHNVSNNYRYVRAISMRELPAEQEQLQRHEQINEYILTSLRTDGGCDLEVLKSKFAYDVRTNHAGYLADLQKGNLVYVEDHRLKLTGAGKLLADKIASDLFLIE